MPNNTNNKISSYNIKEDKTYNKVKQTRFTSIEMVIVVAVILVIFGIMLYFSLTFINDAKETQLQANEQTLYLAAYATLTQGDYTPTELDKFLKKYNDYTDVNNLLSGKSKIETNICSYLSKSFEINDYISTEELEKKQEDTNSQNLKITGKIKITFDNNILNVSLVK